MNFEKFLKNRYLVVAIATSTLLTLAALALKALPAFAQGGQASITLNNYDAKYCYIHDNKWDLAKDVTSNSVVNGSGTVTWTIKAVKSDGGTKFTVHGGITVTNTGTAAATIGNIVVNLQKPNSPKVGSNAPFVSIAADGADAFGHVTDGQAPFDSFNIVATSSQENAATNAAWGTVNYTTGAGGLGTFKETACSGRLEFKDASDNSLFSLVPQPIIPVGGSITLLYDAEFNVACLPASGTVMRVETLVTFGNSGARGGSGAVGSNIDINGNGLGDTEEAKVRTVPCRVLLASLAAPEECNSTVTVTDAGATGTVFMSNPTGFDAFPATINKDTTFIVSVDVAAGAVGGTVCNAAHLQGTTTTDGLTVVVQRDTGFPAYDSLGNQIGWYATFTCCVGADLSDEACGDVAPENIPVPGFSDGSFCTFSQGAFGNTNSYGYKNVLSPNFFSLYGVPGVTVGYIANFQMTFTSALAVANYLPVQGPGNTPGVLTANQTNPTSTSSGIFGGQVLTLRLTRDLSNAAVTATGFGFAKLCNLVDDATEDTKIDLTATQAAALNGKFINQILADAENVLGGNGTTSAYGLSVSQLNALVDLINLSFDKEFTDSNGIKKPCGGRSTFAVNHLCP